MIPLPLLLAALGAGIGAATSKKDRGKGALKGALLGGLGGLVAPALGIGAGGAAASQAGYAATAGGIGAKMGLGLGSSTAAGSAAASTAGLAGSEVAKQGLLKGFMGSELGKGLMGQMGANIIGGGGQPQPQMTDVSFPGVGYTEAPIAPTIGGASPLGMATPEMQMQQEILRRRMMGGYYA